MKLIIDIPEEVLKSRHYCRYFGAWSTKLTETIENGTPYEERPQGEPVIKCQDCKYRVKEWREDKRMKEKGYWVYGCEHFGKIMGYWGFGGNDNEFCSDAERKGGAE